MHDPDDDSDNASAAQRWTAFDCVECNANNPVDDGFDAGDEVTCHYCGSSFKTVISNGKLRFKTL